MYIDSKVADPDPAGFLNQIRSNPFLAFAFFHTTLRNLGGNLLFDSDGSRLKKIFYRGVLDLSQDPDPVFYVRSKNDGTREQLIKGTCTVCNVLKIRKQGTPSRKF
jgi:hypothetical protein